MSNEGTTNYYAYLGPLGQVVCDEVSFSALKGRISDWNIRHLRGGYGVSRVEGKSQAIMNVTGVKNEIRYFEPGAIKSKSTDGSMEN